MSFEIGTRVKKSGYVIWLSCGREPMKSGDGISSPGLEITWDDKTVSKCLDYLVVKA
jgi:hypothetical protein